MQYLPEHRKGRGARQNNDNPFLRHHYDTTEAEFLDEAWEPTAGTQVFIEHPKSILNRVTSPDVPGEYSLNPYQGCEHGCSYCYARNSHQYYGFSAGLDFESKIIVKKNAADLLDATLRKRGWKPTPIMFSGNTDCYQPLERTHQITRQCLEVFNRFSHPVGMITKNSLILRDLDLLSEMANRGLAHVYLTVTTLDEELRRKMEPRTSPGLRRIDVIRQLSEAGVPTGVMLGPVIPGLNHHEASDILKAAAEAGACQAGYTYVHLNGQIGPIFEHWLRQAYPDRAEKVLSQIKAAHQGKLNDSRFGLRMRGEGELAEGYSRWFKLLRNKYFGTRSMPAYNLEAFAPPLPSTGQLRLF